jgi:hypothetical protein
MINHDPFPYSRAWWMARKGIGSLVAFIAVSCGLFVAIIDRAVVEGFKPRPRQDVPLIQRQEEEGKRSLDFCLTHFGVTYGSGALIYRWFGGHSSVRELRSWSSWHMSILNVLAAFCLILGGWQALRQAMVIRPSIFVGLFLIGMTSWDVWNLCRGKKNPSVPG